MTRRAAAALLCGCAAAARLSRDLYAFDNGTGRDQKLPPGEQAELLARHGYAGMGLFTGTRGVGAMRAALESRGLRLLGIYVQCFVDGTGPRIETGLADAVRELSGSGAMIVLTVRGRDPAAEDRAAANLRDVATVAANAGLTVCLYPHVGFHVETAADGIRIIRRAGVSNAGVALNLFHEVARRGRDVDFAPLVREALPYLRLVSVNGISGGKVDRLDRGDYDLAPFVRALESAGYRGPVSLQCYNVKGDLGENLRAARAAWLALQ